MSTSITSGENCIGSSGEVTKDQLVEIVVQLKDDHEELRSDHEQLKDDHEELRSDHEQLKDELSDTKEHAGKERAELAGRVSEVEEQVSPGGNPTPEGSETTLRAGDLTPIEQLSGADDVSDVTDSPTVERAVALFKNLHDWGSKTPKGIVLKPADNPVALLEADRDESLCWKQFYRAAETLEQLSEGSVTFFDSDRHGKMVCLHEQSETFERAVNGELTTSSVGAKG